MNGGLQTVWADSSSFNTTVNGNTFASSGYESVQSGGTAIGTTVNIHGGEIVYAGGTVESAHINGGMVDLMAGANASGVIDFGANGGKLFVEQSIDAGQLVFGATIGNIANGGNIDLSGLKFVDGSHTILDGNVLTVTNGVASESFLMSGDYHTNFTVVNDGHGGTLLEAHQPADAMVNTTGFSHDAHALLLG